MVRSTHVMDGTSLIGCTENARVIGLAASTVVAQAVPIKESPINLQNATISTIAEALFANITKEAARSQPTIFDVIANMRGRPGE
jgi:hypothetical protein